MLQPEDVGLPRTRCRRTPGLRREEVAALCALSPAYYGSLERHGGSRPSPITLARIARTLRFTHADRDRIFTAAGYDPNREAVGLAHVDAASMLVLSRLADTPVLAVDDVGCVLHQTRAAAALFGAAADGAGWERSGFHRWFTSPRERDRIDVADRGAVSAEIVAELRGARGGVVDELVGRLRHRSAEFAALWAHGEHDRALTRLTVVHPAIGRIELRREVLRKNDFRLVIYTAAPGSEAHAKLALAAVVGHHRFGP